MNPLSRAALALSVFLCPVSAGAMGPPQASIPPPVLSVSGLTGAIGTMDLQQNTFSANVGGFPTTGWPDQGAYFVWNYTQGQGETDFFFGQGPASIGGLNFYPVNSSGGTVTPSAWVARLDMTGNFSVAEHYQFNGSSPTISGCGGTTTPNAGSYDNSGSVTEGSSSTGCTVTFQESFTNGHCVVTSPTGKSLTGYTDPVTTQLVITHASASGDEWAWKCN